MAFRSAILACVLSAVPSAWALAGDDDCQAWSDGSIPPPAVWQFAGYVPVQQPLNEDLFLAPQLGAAVLHLDVPYSVDVLVSYVAVGGNTIQHVVQSRGRYRDLHLTGLDARDAQRIEVRAVWYGTTPPGKDYRRSVKRTTHLKAGDRRHLAIREQEFERDQQPTSTAVIFCAAPSEAGSREPPAEPKPPTHVFRFEPEELKLTAFVEYPKEIAAGGRAKAFVFAKAKKTPDLTLIHAPPAADKTVSPEATAKVTLRATWEGLAKDVVVTVDAFPVKFAYEAENTKGMATLAFDADGDSELRKKFEEEVVKSLSAVDRPSTMTMTATVEFGGVPYDVVGTIAIDILEP